MATSINELYYTQAEAARILGVERHYLWTRVKSGELEGERVGRMILFRRDVIDAMVAARAHEADGA